MMSRTLTMAWLNLDSISPSSQSKASPLSRNSSAMRREHSVDRRWMLKSRVAFSWACRLSGSSPFTITSFLLSSLTPRGQMRGQGILDHSPTDSWTHPAWRTQSRYSPSTTLMGCRSEGRRGLMWKIFWAFQIMRNRLQGRTTWSRREGRIVSQRQPLRGSTSLAYPFLPERTLLSPVGKMTLSTSRSSRIRSNSLSSSFWMCALLSTSFTRSSCRVRRRALSLV